jgi:hypothetical protein
MTRLNEFAHKNSIELQYAVVTFFQKENTRKRKTRAEEISYSMLSNFNSISCSSGYLCWV